eukprot:7527413-Pyramimonas_sp.AAC.1
MAQARRDHWGEVFKARPLSRSLRRRQLGAERRARAARGGARLPAADDPKWQLRPRDVRAALERAPFHGAGPGRPALRGVETLRPPRSQRPLRGARAAV